MSWNIKKIGVTTAAGVAVCAGTLVAGTGSATAAPSASYTRTVTSCAWSNWGGFLRFPDRGGFSSIIINPGRCWVAGLPADSDVPVELWFNGGPRHATHRIGSTRTSGQLTTFALCGDRDHAIVYVHHSTRAPGENHCTNY